MRPQLAPSFFMREIDSILIMGLVFILPLFFLSFTPDPLEFNKHALVVLGASGVAVIFFLKSLVSGSFVFIRSITHTAALLVIVASFFISLFSADKNLSFIGFGFGSHETFLTQLSLFLLYFVIASSFTERKILLLIKTFIISGIVIGLIHLIALSGIFSAFISDDFSTIGSPSSAGLFVASVLAAAIGGVLFWKGVAQKLVTVGAIFLFIIGIVLFNGIIWKIFIVTVVCMLLTHLLMFRRSHNSALASVFLGSIIGLSIGFLLFAPLSGFLSAPFEVSPSLSLSADIAKQSLIDKPFFGIGPSNWVIAYNKYFPPDVNSGNFWNVTFAQAGSRILALPVVGGIAALFTWCLFMAVIGLIGLKKIYKFQAHVSLRSLVRSFNPKGFVKNDARVDMVQLSHISVPVFFAWITLALGQIFVGSNINLEVMFWVLSALLVAIPIQTSDNGGPIKESIKNKTIHLSRDSFAFQLVGIATAILFIVMVGEGIIFIRRYAAVYTFNQAIHAVVEGRVKESLDKAQLAIRLEPVKAFYLRSLSNLAVDALSKETDKAIASEDKKADLESLQTYSIVAANSVDALVVAQSGRADNWYQRARVYEILETFNFEGAGKIVLDSLDRAQELAPYNPLLFTEEGNVQLRAWFVSLNASEAQEDTVKLQEKAKEQFLKAIELKQNYAPPRISLATMYYRLNKMDEVEKQVTVVLSFDSENLDAHYLMGLVLDSKGNKQGAIEEFEFVLKANPDNEEVKKIIENLKAGKPALEGIGPQNLPDSNVSQ